MATITFPAKATTQIGEIVRYNGKSAKFWEVIEVKNGQAKAKAKSFGTDPRVACC